VYFHATSPAYGTRSRRLHQHYLLQDLRMRGFTTIFGDYTSIASAKSTFFQDGFHQIALQEGLRQNHDDSPPTTLRHEGTSPTPSLSTLA
jgi:hypothetical protein